LVYLHRLLTIQRPDTNFKTWNLPIAMSKKKTRRFLKYTLIAAAGVFLVILGTVAVIAIATLNSLPPLELLENQQISESTKIYDRTGERVLFELYDEERRTIIAFDQIPQYVKDATVAIEDSDFYNHHGFSIRGFIRALWINARTGERTAGGSTITQQLAKNVFLSPEKTFTRKLKELVLSYKLESTFDKDRILELYLNEIPYGGTAYGIESASETYFSKSTNDLTLAESALLASLPQAPTYYSPWGSHVDDLMERKNTVLRRMADLGYITEAEMTAAQEEELQFAKPRNSKIATHFVIGIKEYLDEKYGEDFVRRSGLKVVTTLDADLQEIAEAAVSAGAERNTDLYGGTNAALVAQDATTGQILAMVGSRDYFDEEIDGQFNVATQGLRQPGSALKPFAYLAALKMGYPEQTVLFDVQTEFNSTGASSYQPQNFDSRFRGPVNFRTALSQSINVPAVKTLYLIGINNLIETLDSFGVQTLTDPRRYGLSLVLGGGEVKLIDLVGAYSTLAQEGIYHEKTMILKITTREGKILEEYEDKATQVIEPEYPRVINDILSDVQARSGLFSSSLNLTVFPGHDVAIKTGTTNDYRDAWAVGYTPALAVGVWAGNNDSTPMIAQGGSILAAVPMLSAFLSEALETQTPVSFAPIAPSPETRPMLNGQYTAYYTSGDNTYPHIHNILHYVNKRTPTGSPPTNPASDSQYANWETSVLQWAHANIPGFIPGITYNQPVPPSSRLTQKPIPRPADPTETDEDFTNNENH